MAKMPNVRGMAMMDAVTLLENKGLSVRYQDIGFVKKQSIPKGTRVKKGIL